jgi:hypothetical protein
MKRKTFYIALSVTLLAIIVVGAFSVYYKLYVSVPEANADIDMELVYANFWASNIDNNANVSDGLISYITVIDITNHASQTAYITDVTIDVAQNVTVYPTSANVTINSPSVNVSHDSSHVFSGIAIMVQSVSLDDKRDGLQLKVEPGSYRLVAITGLTTSTDFLASRELFLKANAEPAYVKGKPMGIYDIQDLSTFQQTNNGILYNTLLTGNQTLSINGLDASINYPVSTSEAYLSILARGFGLLSNSKAELITTDMHPASARTTARTGFKMPKAAKLNATMFQINA